MRPVAARGCIIAMPPRTTAEQLFAKAKADATQTTLAFTVGLAHAAPPVARNSVMQAVVAEAPESSCRLRRRCRPESRRPSPPQAAYAGAGRWPSCIDVGATPAEGAVKPRDGGGVGLHGWGHDCRSKNR